MVVILLVAFSVRALGSNFGLPFTYHPDEHFIVYSALQMERAGEPDPHWFHYPSLWIYLHVLLVAILHPAADVSSGPIVGGLPAQVSMDLQSQARFYQLARLLTVLAGTATVWLTYLAGRRFYRAEVGLWSAVIAAVVPLHIESSRYITTDVPSTLFVAACLYATLAALETRSLRGLVLSALLAGLAASTKYNAGLVLVTPIAACLVCRPKRRMSLAGMLLLLFMTAMAGFLAGTPYAALDFGTFRMDLVAEMHHYQVGHPGSEGTGNWLWFLGRLFRAGLGPLLTCVVLAGLGRLAFRRRREEVPIWIFPLLYYALVASQRVRFERNLVPLVPFFALVAGAFVAEAVGWSVRGLSEMSGDRVRHVPRPAVLGLALLLLVGEPLAREVSVGGRMAGPDTRTTAFLWAQSELRPGARIAVESYGPPLEYCRPPGGSGRLFNIATITRLSDRPLSWYTEQHIDYLVASSWMYERYMTPESGGVEAAAPEASFYRSLAATCTLVREFSGHPAPMHDPIIRIYALSGG